VALFLRDGGLIFPRGWPYFSVTVALKLREGWPSCPKFIKAEIKLIDCPEPYAVIYTKQINEEVQRVLDYLQKNSDTIIGASGEKSYIILINEIVKATVQDERTYLWTERGKYVTNKRLYEIKSILGTAFVQISRSVIVRISACSSIETDFGGMLLLHLKDGSQEYVSRHYVTDFKKRIGL